MERHSEEERVNSENPGYWGPWKKRKSTSLVESNSSDFIRLIFKIHKNVASFDILFSIIFNFLYQAILFLYSFRYWSGKDWEVIEWLNVAFYRIEYMNSNSMIRFLVLGYWWMHECQVSNVKKSSMRGWKMASVVVVCVFAAKSDSKLFFWIAEEKAGIVSIEQSMTLEKLCNLFKVSLHTECMIPVTNWSQRNQKNEDRESVVRSMTKALHLGVRLS